MAGVRLAGWSEKDELNEIIDELSLDTHVMARVTGHGLQAERRWRWK
jgi:hypothetical protein